jgi:hypothetical protein
MLLIKEILPELLQSETDWKLCIFKNWQSIVGSLKTRIRLEKVYDTTAVIGVYESHWMQELFLLSRVLIASINKHLDKPRITELRFKLVEENKRKRAVVQVPSCVKVRQYTLNTHQQHALAAIEDKELRQALESFLKSCMER